MSAEPNTIDESMIDRELPRRQFMIGSAVAVAGLTATSGLAAANNELNWNSDFAPNTRITGPVTYHDHDRSETDSIFEFVGDDGEWDDHRDYGAAVAPQDEQDAEDDVPYNPVSLTASYIDAEAYHVFPRDVTRDDGDGGEEDVSALDASEWDDSDTAVTISDRRSEAGGKGVLIEAAPGDTAQATATFDNFEVTSSLDRRRLLVVYDAEVTTMPTGAEIRVYDTAGNYKSVDLSTEAGEGHVLQADLGDIASSADPLSEYDSIEIFVDEGDIDYHIVGLDLERERRLSFGVEEFEDADEELDTQEVEEPSGEYSITGVDTLDSVFANALLDNVTVETEFHISRIGSNLIETRFSDADRYEQPHMLEIVANFELPDPFSISYGLLEAEDTVRYPHSRYVTANVATDSEKTTFADIEDEEDPDWTNRAARYDDSMDEDVLLDSDVPSGDFWTLHTEILASESERDSLESSSVAAGPTGREGGGLLSRFLSLPGVIVSALGIFGASRLFSRMRS